MSQTFYKIWIHLVWSTKDREPYLRKEIREQVFEHIKEKAQKEGYHLDEIDGAAEHVHCLISLQPKFSVSEVVNKLKGETSHWINSTKLTKTHFAWQGGFGAFSVGESDVPSVRTYIQNQEEHHRKKTFAEEVKEFLATYNAEQLSEG